ncbi:hypothetical protein [Sphingobacterium griseoflavum]|uniref:Uncharacterized protein n=1 Tax=Sphingobacterium griseoflavum TaxID=1474952 RepID=A0ABQ3HWT4_9SPHI|nr:hypothetical protein [Sphingobacterium griseoflavum]GHE35480.1 hypothetical protein GCM10017764_18460 [Sphingobacterium griseoflavum]
MKQKKTSLLIHSLLYAIGWGVFAIFLLPLGSPYRGLSPCDATPSQSLLTVGILLICYLALFGSWLYQIGSIMGVRKGYMVPWIAASLILPYFISGGIGVLLYEEITRIAFTSWGLFPWFYTYGCYQDVEVKESSIFLLTAILLLPLSYQALKSSMIQQKNNA